MEKRKTGYHFDNEEAILLEAIKRPDIFLQCCQNLFGEMLATIEKVPHHPAAQDMAEGLFVLFTEFAFFGKRNQFQIILDAVFDGVGEANKKMRMGTPQGKE
ncbi:MAG: hypothetical protein GX945_13725 [Lentisphaerae bacterium]|nr:hypothetical protein [Lentisphaerota bacterium]